MNRTFTLVILLAITVLFTVGCDESASSHSHEIERTEDENTNTVERRDGLVIVHITGNDQMQYNIKEFTVRSGDHVRLIFEHVGKLAANVMGHNVAILAQQEDPLAFGSQVIANNGNPDNDYLPPAMRDRVLAHTKMIGGGDKDTIEFVAPAPGEYPYLCTFPGHYAAMNGQMIVK